MYTLGNTNTAIFPPGETDISNRVAGDMRHSLDGHDLGWKPDAFFIPSIPGVKGYFIQMMSTLLNFPALIDKDGIYQFG